MSPLFPFISADILVALVLILIIICITLLIIVWNIHKRLKSFLIDVDAKNIDESLKLVSGDLRDIQKFRTEMEQYLTTVENRLQNSVQTVNTIRFNPFKGTGGGSNQSFATAFLNQKGDGVVISSLYSRDHVSVFSKPIKGRKSEFELTEEERGAVEGK